MQYHFNSTIAYKADLYALNPALSHLTICAVCAELVTAVELFAMVLFAMEFLAYC